MYSLKAIIKPGSSKGPQVISDENGVLVLYVREPATEGKANKAAINLLAKHLGVPKTSVILQKGRTARYKTFTIEGESS